MKISKQFGLSALAIAVLTSCGHVPASQQVQPTSAEVVTTAQAENIDTKAQAIIAKMSLDEKARIVSGMGLSMTTGKQGDFDRVPGTAGYTYGVDSLGLKSIALADGPAGLRIWPTREGDENTYYATAFPIASLVAATWDDSLVEQVGLAMGQEVKEYGVDVLLAPGMNIHRNPLNGRNFEYYSEDPLLSGNMAAAMVNGIEANDVGATIKHYVANNQETSRLDLDSQISERALREIYLKGFEIAVRKSSPWAVMSAYNGVNGTPSSEHSALLTDVLRGEWGYDGVVMTDWFAGKDPVAQLKAGNDLLMPGMPERTQQIKAAINDGRLTEADLDTNVKRIVEMVLKSPTQAGYDYSDKPDLKAHAQVVREVAAQGVVLLKNNDGALPLSQDINNIGAFGVGSYAFIAGGTGSGDVNKAYTVSLVEGLTNADLNVDLELARIYQEFREQEEAQLPKKELFFLPDLPIAEMELDPAMLKKVVARTDVGLITLGRSAGEFIDRNMDADYLLTEAEKKMIASVSEAYHEAGKQVVLVMNIGNVVEMASWQDNVDAIVLPWQGGQEAGNAVTDVLIGKVNPSGRLPTTIPLAYADSPSAGQKRFPGKVNEGAESIKLMGLDWGKPSKVWYEEGIFVGYRYFDTFNVDVAYPFGFGLSYTNFAMQNASTSTQLEVAETLQLPVEVTNTGQVAGKQVVQLFVSAPKGKLIKPAKELKAYAKTAEIAPGKTETITLSVNKADLASYDPSRQSWVLEPGKYEFHVSSSIDHVAYSLSMHIQKEEVVNGGLTALPNSLPLSTINP